MLRIHLIVLMILCVLAGCSSHSSRHTSRARVFPCPSAPCGDHIRSDYMDMDFVLIRHPSGEYVLSGTAMPKGRPPSTRVELAVLSVELTRDLTVGESFSFPMIGNDLTQPLRFEHRFTPEAGFDGLTFNWDIRYAE